MALALEHYRKRTSTFIRFLLVGLINTFVGLSIIFLLLNVFGISYWLSTFSGNAIGMLVSFLLNRVFTFKSSVSFTKGAPKFLLVSFVCYFTAYSIGALLADGIYWLIDFSYLLTVKELAVLCGTGLYTLLNYAGQKYIVFYPTRNQHTIEKHIK
ncbi:MAG TPA: GtrA family protein [Chondromyces sp.]|nr:GtrA family protein [Chondromyces sp.]